MKRLLALALIVFGLGVIAAQTAFSAGDPQGPPCSNITDGDGGYNTEGVLEFSVFFQAPMCSFVTYSFFVTDTDGHALSPVTTPTKCTPATGGDCLHYIYYLGSNAPSTICVYATTSIHSHVADRAPNSFDASCPALPSSASLTNDGSGASGGFN